MAKLGSGSSVSLMSVLSTPGSPLVSMPASDPEASSPSSCGVVRLHQGHVRQVGPADLVNAVGDEEESLRGGELALPPQAPVHRVGTLTVGCPPEGVDIPDDRSGGVPDHAGFPPGYQAPVSVVEVGPVSHVSGARELQLP
jgi:hypothetical protein